MLVEAAVTSFPFGLILINGFQEGRNAPLPHLALTTSPYTPAVPLTLLE